MTESTLEDRVNMLTAIDVRLTPSEMFQAALVACQRQIENRLAGRQETYGSSEANAWSLHIEGAGGEMAFAKASGRYWSGNVGNLKANDVGRVEVRTRSKHSYDLIVHKRDPDDRAFVLVTGLMPEYRIHGWLWGRDAKLREYWKDPAGGRPAFFVPKEVLKPITRVTSYADSN